MDDVRTDLLQTEVATTATDDPDVEITADGGRRTADGATGTYPLFRFEDSGVGHVRPRRRDPGDRPVAMAERHAAAGALRLSPVHVRQRIRRLARQYPALVDVLDLSNKSQGHRTATAYLVDPAAAAVVVESVRFGDQGMNGVHVRTVDPGRRNRPRTVTWPSNTGPVADVLYSAAGNSADQLYYEQGILAWDFEVGIDRWNEATQEWDGVGFQPPYEEAHAESQEYASGLVELVRVARDYAAATAG